MLQEAAGAGEHFHPVLPGLIVLLPLLGFLANGLLALTAGVRSSHAVRSGHDGDHGHGHDHGHAAKPFTHTLPSLIGPGVMGVAFALALVNFVGMLGADLHGN